MFSTKLGACLLAGLVATTAVAGPMAASTAAKFKPGHQLAQTPLGRLILGNVGRLMVLRSELNATDQQRDQVRRVLESHQAQIARQAKNVWTKRIALRDAVMGDSSDEKAVRQAADELGDAIGDAAVLAARLRGELEPVFSDEQKERVDACRRECDKAVERFFAEVVEKP